MGAPPDEFAADRGYLAQAPRSSVNAEREAAVTERRQHEQQNVSRDDRQPDVKPELIRDLDVPSDETDAIAGGNSVSRVVDQTH